MTTRRTVSTPELYVLSALALLTRFWGLLYPNVVVWDETHFEKFAGAYFTGRYYVDVHPPLGKLLLAGAAKLLGISGATLAANQPAPLLRVLPALAGALIVPGVFLLARELGTGRRVATLAAAMLLVDNALLAESRLILMDSMLILAAMSAVLFYVMARRRDGRSHDLCIVAAAAAAGIAVSIKWTGLSALGLILLTWFVDAVVKRRNIVSVAGEAFAFVVIPATIYLSAFAVHFSLLTNAGIGDGWMSPAFRATLAGDPAYVRGATMPLARSVRELHRVMNAINLGWAADTNNGSSPWYTWPVAKHSMGFWSPTVPGREPERWIVLFANPMVWFGVIAGLGVLLAMVALSRRGDAGARVRFTPDECWALAFLTAGYLINYVPFAFITRPMYLYHYFLALIFSVLIASIAVGRLAGWSEGDDARFWSFPSRASSRVYAGVLVLAAVTFLYLAPMSYGWPLSPSGVEHRRWVIERRF